jgi:hypothetical protein
MPWDISGCVFSGLNPNSTLQVNLKLLFERVPSQSNKDLLVLARTPPGYDGMALEIYSKAMEKLPVGVPVGENPLGEWFADVLKVVGDVAPVVGDFVGNFVPGVKIAGNLIGAGAKAGHSALVKKPATPQPQAQGRQAQKKPRNKGKRRN